MFKFISSQGLKNRIEAEQESKRGTTRKPEVAQQDAQAHKLEVSKENLVENRRSTRRRPSLNENSI